MANILHIEDDPQSLLLVRKLLVAAGHRVVETSSGLEGARLASEEPFDLILLDINVPDLDGYEVAMLLRGRLPGVPIVAVTAEGDRTQSLALGCDGFVAKPIDVRQFPRLVADYLGGRRERAEREVTPVLRAQSQRMAEHLEAKVQQLSEANQRLLEADRLRKEFYRNVTHELATPLTPLVGYLDLLSREELGPLAAPQKKALTAMREAMGRLRGTIDNLLDVTQLEAGRMRFRFGAYDLRALVQAAVDARREALAAAGLQLSTLLPSAPVPAQGDAERLQRALVHLLDNALKFTLSGGAVAVELRSKGSTATVLVSDSGPGVRSEMLQRIFEPFVQGDGSVTRAHEGSGVGLAVVRRVAEVHGGSVLAEAGGRELVAGQRLGGLLVRFELACTPRPPGPTTGQPQ